jgi:hypothetical protein|tara:strand:- start:1050 stop:1550 length:501 start_codon:yes stop_codon:yes gene_type:complete
MGQFNNKITATFDPPRKWIMKKDLTYTCTDLSDDEAIALATIGVQIENSNRLRVKEDFVTDLASVPRICWNLIAPWDVARAAIIHDLLYKRIRQYRWNAEAERGAGGIILGEDKSLVKAAKKAADKVFLCGMKDASPSVPKWKIYSAYYAVALFGRWSIKPNEENI